MKRVSKLFAGCLCIFAMASIIGCKNDDGGGSDELKASVNKATAASVSVEEGTYDSVVKEDDKTTINTALDSAGIDKLIAGATDYSGFVKDGESGTTYSMRAMTAEELGTKVYKDLEEKITKYNEDFYNNRKASFNYTIAPGEITGLDDGVKMTIPLFYISQSASASSDGTSTAQSYTQGICSTYFRDFTKSDSNSQLKQTAVNSAQNYNYNLAATLDPTKVDYEKIQNGECTDISERLEYMTIKGSAKINLETTSYTSFLIDGIAGKIAAELNLDVEFTDFDKIFEDAKKTGSISPETVINSDTSTASLKIDVCDLDGKVIYNYKTSDDFSEIESYISLFDLSSVINGTDDSEE